MKSKAKEIIKTWRIVLDSNISLAILEDIVHDARDRDIPSHAQVDIVQGIGESDVYFAWKEMV